ncbi:MAG: ABC transporter ATP-binding protein [Bacillota bacterium]
MNVIEVNNLNKVYGVGDVAVGALKDVSFSVTKGEFVAVMGPSGSGKSTLLNLLGCFDTPTEGDYFLDGTDVKELSDKELARIRNRKIGFIFQSYNLLPRFSALKNVEQPMIYKGVRGRERLKTAREALEKVGLGDRMDHKPNELSGGQRQRVAIARSLVNDPRIILADEPTGNLDSGTENEILEVMVDLNLQGITIVMVTHERVVAEHAERILHFKDGKLMREEKLIGNDGGDSGEDF